MAYRGGSHGGRGDRGDQRGPPYKHGRGDGGGRSSRFVWLLPASTLRPVPGQYQAATMGFHAPVPHQGAYGHPAPVVYRPAAPPAPQVVFTPPPAPVLVTIRAPPPAPSPAPAASTHQPANAPAPASSAPSAAALAKEVEKKLFVSETALAPAAAAASAAVATQEGKDAAADDAPEVDLAPVSKKGMAHPARPGVGTVGKKVMIRANHFLVDVAANNLFHYDVSINPESKSRQTNREVLNELIKLHGQTSLGGKLPAYDGRKSLYTAGSLPFESEEFVVTLVDPEKKEKERAEREYRITIRIAGRTDMYHLTQFLRGRQRDMPQETIQVLDVVLRESPSWNYVTVSRSFFSTSFGHRGDVGEGLECWRGYYQSLRPTQMGLSLNIDISATSFFKPVSVIKFVEEFLNIRDTSRPLSDRDRVKIKKALRGVRIETSHQQDQIRRYKITGITPIPMSQLIFPVDEQGTRKTVVQYFWDKYDYRLKYASWPCLQAGSDSRPVYLPMEVCKIVEGQRYSKKLNDKQVTNILRATCKRPQEREQSIRDMVLHNKYAEDRFAQEFGIQVCNDLVSVPARVLPPPLLKYHESGREKVCAPSVGQWNMINKKMINGGTVNNWTCLNFSRMHPEEVKRFCIDLIHMCNATGMAVNPHPFIDVRSASPNQIENTLRDVHRRASQAPARQGVGNQIQLLIIILPDVSGSYGKIKRVCETDIGIVSQCCLSKHASRSNKQYLKNVALKINVKVGGRNTVLERAFVRNGIPFVSEVPTIIFGADAAVVASMDWPEITKYRGLVSAQPQRQEIIEDLFTVSKDPQKGHNVNGGMIRELLIAFSRKTNRRPERVIFYRDGVSEGQFSHVLLHMDAIKKACASLEEGYLPPVTFVVVQKRHHTRLFPEFHGRRDMTYISGNILPGTVVDQKICHPTEFDFYLCSHAGIQGTSLPTHYHVLYDENHFTTDALKSLTNNTRAVSVDHKIEQLNIMEEGNNEKENISSGKDVEVRVEFNGKYTRMMVPIGTPVRVPVEAVMANKSTLTPDEYYLINENRGGIQKEAIVTESINIHVNLSIDGGGKARTSHPHMPLKQWMALLKKRLFRRVKIPTRLRKRGDGRHEVVCLSKAGRRILKMLLEWLERIHRDGDSLDGAITLDDLIIFPGLDIIDINPSCIIDWKPLDQISYIKDCNVILEFIDEYLLYLSTERLLEPPMYVKELKMHIIQLDPKGNTFACKDLRSLVFNSVAAMGASKRIGLLIKMHIKYRYGFDMDDKKKFKQELELTAGPAGADDWKKDVQGIRAPEEMMEVYKHRRQEFSSGLLGQIQFSRVLLHHPRPGYELKDLQLEGGLYLLWPTQIPDLHAQTMKFNTKLQKQPTRRPQNPPSTRSGAEIPEKQYIGLSELFQDCEYIPSLIGQNDRVLSL